MKMNKPIGIFDSGVGGLSVCRAVKRCLPNEHILYFADQRFSPYGEKSPSEINDRCKVIADLLVQRECKALVVACNTATVNAVSSLRSAFSLPIVGIEPAIKVAALASKNGKIAVLATPQTLLSDNFHRLTTSYAGQVEVTAVPCPEFIPLVEQLKHETSEAFEAVNRIVKPLLARGCDQIVLGCTHYSFLNRVLSQITKGRAELIDTADPVAAQLERILNINDLLSPSKSSGKITFLTSDPSSSAAASIQNLWGEKEICITSAKV